MKENSVLEMKNICKSFSGVSVLKDNHLELEAGEVPGSQGTAGSRFHIV